MNQKLLAEEFDRNFVYVKEVAVGDLPSDVRDDLDEFESMFAVHDAAGACLALVANRQLAFHLARENELTPVTVH